MVTPPEAPGSDSAIGTSIPLVSMSAPLVFTLAAFQSHDFCHETGTWQQSCGATPMIKTDADGGVGKPEASVGNRKMLLSNGCWGEAFDVAVGKHELSFSRTIAVEIRQSPGSVRLHQVR